MANVPYLIVSPNAVLSFLGLLRGPDRTKPTPREDWRQASVEVVIPALNEAENIVLAIASVLKQSMPPKRIVVIDDGSSDQTYENARAFCADNHVELLAVKRARPIGKTPTLKRQSRESDADVIFILDADTILDAPNYIERTVEELFKAAGIASACGIILPLRQKDRRQAEQLPTTRTFLAKHPQIPTCAQIKLTTRLSRTITNLYRDALYMFLQRFVYHGQMVFFGSIINPVGCAVAYRRQYLKDLFDRYEPTFGDNLTNSEDVFIGFALSNHGYRNIQLQDVTAHSEEPQAIHLPRQLYLWSSAFLQSCYYFDPIVRSPFKGLRAFFYHRRKKKELAQRTNLRRVQEPYRQRFGEEHTKTYGRPLGWSIFTSLFEKISFPVVMLIFLLLGKYDVIYWTLALETALTCSVLWIIAKGQRFEYFFKGVLITPLRYASVAYDLVTMSRFTFDLLRNGKHKWRK